MAGKRGESLTVFAIIALMLLLLLAVIFGTGGFAPGKVYKNRDILYVSSVGTVGESKETFRHIPIGNARIGLSGETSPLAEEEGPITVVRGVLTSDDYVLNIPGGKLKEGGLLGFGVLDTSGYGSLVIWVNGAVVWSGKPKAGEKIEVPFQASTRIRFSATSSGWKFWSPSVYTIGQVRVAESGHRQQKRGFNFEVGGEEVDEWSIGRIVFRIADASETARPDLLVKVNNATVFAGKPSKGSLPVIVDFGKSATAINKGNNTLSFEVAGEGSYDIDDVEAIIFSNVEGRREPTFRFELTQDDIDGLKEGRLTGLVTFKVLSPGSLSVFANGASGGEKVLLREAWKEAGTVDLPFGPQQATAGVNRLSFNSSSGIAGNQSVTIGNLYVRLYR